MAHYSRGQKFVWLKGLQVRESNYGWLRTWRVRWREGEGDGGAAGSSLCLMWKPLFIIIKQEPLTQRSQPLSLNSAAVPLSTPKRSEALLSLEAVRSQVFPLIGSLEPR